MYMGIHIKITLPEIPAMAPNALEYPDFAIHGFV
jgi:hypothetical protein